MLGQLSFQNLTNLQQKAIFKYNGRKYTRTTWFNHMNNEVYVKVNGEYLNVWEDIELIKLN